MTNKLYNISDLKNNPLWNDWRWQLKNAIKSKADLMNFLNLTSEEQEGFDQVKQNKWLPISITPYFLSLINKDDANDPLRVQIVPHKKEFVKIDFERRDPLGEEDHEVVPHLIHRYPDRVLFLITDRCASYCRFCTRKRWVGQGPTPNNEDRQAAFNYIKNNPQIKEVILSGGDALLPADEQLDNIISQLRAIEHIEIIRIHSRMLAFAPMRVTDNLVAILKKYAPIFLVTHFNHANEIGLESKNTLAKLIDNGIPVLNQSVLLKGINNNKDTLETLFRSLTRLRVRPYYLHQCDIAQGNDDFRVPLKEALALQKSLRGHISGICLPTFVIDIPGGFGKTPIVTNSVVKENKDFIYLQGFDGEIAAYPL